MIKWLAFIIAMLAVVDAAAVRDDLDKTNKRISALESSVCIQRNGGPI